MREVLDIPTLWSKLLRLPLQKAFNSAIEDQLSQTITRQSAVNEFAYRQWSVHEMRCAYYIAKKKLPYQRFNDLTSLVRDSIDNYNGDQSFNGQRGVYSNTTSISKVVEMVSVCCKDILKRTTDSIKEASFFSIMVDESNDISSSKSLVVMARYVVYGVVQVRLLGILALLNGTAESISLSILDLISRRDLERVRLVGFASDGASVMVGCKSRVALRLSCKYPGLVSFHCPAHRVDLALQESMTDDDDHKIRAIQTLYSYFSHSHTRLTALEAALDEFNLSHLRPRQVALTRWLSLGESLSVLFETFFALRHVLRNDLNCPVAQDLYNDVFSRDDFYYWVAYMTDVVDVVNQLSKSLQSQSLNVVSVLPVVLAAIDQLEKTFTVCNVQKAPSSLSLRQCHADLGTRFAVHKSKEIRTMHNNCVSYVLRLSHSLKSRFPVESQSIIDAFSVLYPSQMVMCNSLASFGHESIETLASHYSGDLPEVKVVLLEYASYKFYALANFASVSPNDLLTRAKISAAEVAERTC